MSGVPICFVIVIDFSIIFLKIYSKFVLKCDVSLTLNVILMYLFAIIQEIFDNSSLMQFFDSFIIQSQVYNQPPTTEMPTSFSSSVCSSQQPGCSFPSYMTRYSREVWLDNDYHHARETAFVYGRVHKGRFGRATGVVRDSPDAWVTKVQHNSVTQRWRSHKEITFTRDGSQMVIALKQIIPCELQREEDSTDDQFASVIDFHPVLNRSLRQVIGGNTSKGMASNPGSANEGLLNINNFTDSRYYQSSTKQQRGEVTQSPKKVHYWSAETNARILRANGSTARPLANKKRGSKVTDNRRAAREGGEACYEVDLLYKRKCLSKIAPNKYLVLHTSGG